MRRTGSVMKTTMKLHDAIAAFGAVGTTLLMTSAFAQSPTPSIRNIEAPGNLESLVQLDCVPITSVKTNYTPADLYKAAAKCILDDRESEGVPLYAVAEVYGRFDISRVADQTAHQAIQVLTQREFGDLPQDKKASFGEEISRIADAPEQLAKLCQQIRALGPPTYYPRYMIQHGLDAFKARKDDGLVQGFDQSIAWNQALEQHLHCPPQ